MKKIMTVLASTCAFASLPFSVQGATMKKVTFESKGHTLAGNLFLPDNYKANKPLPAVIVTGSWTSVKEQMPGGYAKAMADRGYVALAFDFRGWGDSNTDSLKYLEDPKRKTEDIVAAARFLASRPEVDASKIAGLGICASAGYMADAAYASDLFQSVAMIAPWLHDATIVDSVYGGKDSVQSLIQISRDAEAKFKTTGEGVYVPAASTHDNTAIMQNVPYYTESDRGLIPEYDNKFNLMTWEPWLTYDAIQTAKQLKKPLLLVHSESAAIPEGAKKYLEHADNNAHGLWLEDVTQFEFYDKPEVMAKAADAVAAHFKQSL